MARSRHVEPPADEDFSPDAGAASPTADDLTTEVAFVLGLTNDEARDWIDANSPEAAEERIYTYWLGDDQ